MHTNLKPGHLISTCDKFSMEILMVYLFFKEYEKSYYEIKYITPDLGSNSNKFVPNVTNIGILISIVSQFRPAEQNMAQI